MQAKRKLGRTDIAITPLMLGGNVFGWTADEAASFAVLDAFVDAGGDASDKRNKVVIGTKVGMWPKQLGIKRENILEACDGSLKRLGVDAIDLYWLHRDDEATDAEEYIDALDRLAKAGKVRAVGASNFKPGRFAQGLKESDKSGKARFSAQQPEYHLLNREIEAELMPLCVREQVSLLPYYGLASGYLTGKYRSEADKAKSPRGQRMDKYMQGKGPAVLAALDAVGARH